MEAMPEACILASRVTSGRPRCRAVAAIILSGMSGTASPLILSKDSDTDTVTSSTRKPDEVSFKTCISLSNDDRGIRPLSTKYMHSTIEIEEIYRGWPLLTSERIRRRATSERLPGFSRYQTAACVSSTNAIRRYLEENSPTLHDGLLRCLLPLYRSRHWPKNLLN